MRSIIPQDVHTCTLRKVRKAIKRLVTPLLCAGARGCMRDAKLYEAQVWLCPARLCSELVDAMFGGFVERSGSDGSMLVPRPAMVKRFRAGGLRRIPPLTKEDMRSITGSIPKMRGEAEASLAQKAVVEERNSVACGVSLDEASGVDQRCRSAGGDEGSAQPTTAWATPSTSVSSASASILASEWAWAWASVCTSVDDVESEDDGPPHSCE